MLHYENKYKNYSQRQEITEVIEVYRTLGTLDDMRKTTLQSKLKLKKLEKQGKVYTKVWFEYDEEYDECNHSNTQLVLMGKRTETDEELQYRIDGNLTLRLNDLAKAIIDIRYWLSPEGREELKAMKAVGQLHLPIWLDMLKEIENAHLKCFREKQEWEG